MKNKFGAGSSGMEHLRVMLDYARWDRSTFTSTHPYNCRECHPPNARCKEYFVRMKDYSSQIELIETQLVLAEGG